MFPLNRQTIYNNSKIKEPKTILVSCSTIVNYEKLEDEEIFFKSRFVNRLRNRGVKLMINVGDTNTEKFLRKTILWLIRNKKNTENQIKFRYRPAFLFKCTLEFDKSKTISEPNTVFVDVYRFQLRNREMYCGLYWVRSNCFSREELVEQFISNLFPGTDIIESIPETFNEIRNEFQNIFLKKAHLRLAPNKCKNKYEQFF